MMEDPFKVRRLTGVYNFKMFIPSGLHKIAIPRHGSSSTEGSNTVQVGVSFVVLLFALSCGWRSIARVLQRPNPSSKYTEWN